MTLYTTVRSRTEVNALALATFYTFEKIPLFRPSSFCGSGRNCGALGPFLHPVIRSSGDIALRGFSAAPAAVFENVDNFLGRAHVLVETGLANFAQSVGE